VAFTVILADAADASAVGGKAASLGELSRAGVTVPPGFAVTVEAFALALAVIDADGALRAGIEALDPADLPGIAAAAAGFRALVAGAPLPAEVAAAIEAGYAALGADGAGGGGAGGLGGPDVAVRSSATVEDSAEASFAGLQDTYLGLSGAADESVAYRRRLALPEAGVAMAVVVQRMVAPQAAGVMFTRSPVTGDRSVVAIEGTWGLGSALVSGDVTPDSWAVSKITGEITTRRVSAKLKIHRYTPNEGVASPPVQVPPVQVSDTPAPLRDAACLTDDEVRALAAVARQVEAHYGAPQDIEWAVLDGDSAAGSRIVLLQSRPETVWAARGSAPAGASRPRAADHVLALFGKPL
jgi:pyruvate, water dikinase